jgi:hypothetical protein
MRRTIGGRLQAMVEFVMRDSVILHVDDSTRIACAISSRACID